MIFRDNAKKLKRYLKNEYFKYKYNYYKKLNKPFTIYDLHVICIDEIVLSFDFKDEIQKIYYINILKDIEEINNEILD